MPKTGRNDLCWCGSGKKFKKCHFGREQQERPSIWEMQTRFLNIHKTKVCLHPLAGELTCERGIIRAHTVRKSADLKAIAHNGHVYQGQFDNASFKKHGLRVVPRLVGINEASTFLGFCHAHDSATFAPIETQALIPTNEQAFLLAYRAFAKEIYLKMRQYEVNEMSRDADKGRSLFDQAWIQHHIDGLNIGVQSAIDDLNHHKSMFDADLVVREFRNIRYVAIHFDRIPDIVCSCAIQPTYTFDGVQIQDLSRIDTVLEQVTFTLAATASGGAAIFAWHEQCDRTSGILIDSLLALPDAEKPAALVRFTLSESENAFLRPSWWEKLTAETRRSLEDRINHNLNPFMPIDKNNFKDDGVRAVDWVVTRIDQKRN